MRGNLDVLETWLNDHDLEDLTKYLTRVSMVIDLLATPKVQLMQVRSRICFSLLFILCMHPWNLYTQKIKGISNELFLVMTQLPLLVLD